MAASSRYVIVRKACRERSKHLGQCIKSVSPFACSTQSPESAQLHPSCMPIEQDACSVPSNRFCEL